MTELGWKPLYRAPRSTVTKVLRSPAFVHSRERAVASLEDAAALRALAVKVQTLDYLDAPLSAVADRVTAAIRFLRARADRLDAGTLAPVDPSAHVAADAARERLLVASLYYLVTPVDMVPDFQIGGYIDDVLLLSWIFGAACLELEPFLTDDLDA